jgi:hypothetical protein
MPGQGGAILKTLCVDQKEADRQTKRTFDNQRDSRFTTCKLGAFSTRT